MEETKPKSRATRSRVASVDSDNTPTPPKRSTRAKKIKDEHENASSSRRNSTNGEDYDDGASSKSSNSSHGTRSCKVVLRRENFDEIRNPEKEEEQEQEQEQDQEQDRAIAHATRNRRNSKLTEENVAALSTPALRTLRSASIIDSDGTDSTMSRPTRSRLANSQTPKKDSIVAGPATPKRRSSRLLSENEKAADSPAKTPSKRTLRSNSVASVDDISPPTTRTRSSSRLAESQPSTPKSLKTAVSKIKAEPTTPRRSSTRVNKSVIISEIIDEESSDNDEFDKLVTKKSNKLPKITEIRKVVEEEKEAEKEEEKEEEIETAAAKTDAPLESRTTKDGSQQKTVIETESTGEKLGADLIENELNEIGPIDIEEELPTTPRNIRSTKVLISTSTAKTPSIVSPVQQKADTPTIEPAEPLETSMSVQAGHIEKIETPKVDAKTMEKSKTPQKNSPSVKLAGSSVQESMVEPAIATENPSSPETAKLNSEENIAVEEKDQKEGEHSIRIELPLGASVPLVYANISNDFEPMDIDETLPNVDKDASLKEILANYTPKTKSRVSSGFNAMDVTALAHEENESVQMPKQITSKKSSKRVSLNDTAQSIGFERMEVSILAADSTNNAIENVKSSRKDGDEMKSPKPIKETSRKNSNEKSAVEQLNIKKSTVETPKVETPKASSSKVDSPKAQTSNSKTPKSKLSPKKTPISISLNNEIDKIIAGLETPVASSKFEGRFSAIAMSLTPAISNSFVDNQVDEIASVISPNAPKSPEKSAKMKPSHEDNSEDANEAVEKSVLIDKNDESTINETQSEVETTLPTEQSTQEKPTKPKSDRKSVQIMTPNVVKSQSSEKRVDTPYPPASIIKAAASFSGVDEDTKKSEDKQENLQKLADSWSKSVKRNALIDGSPKPIDKFGTDKMENVPAKKAVPARNNWATRLIDLDAESESDEDFVAESNEEAESCSEEESENSMIDDEAEEIEGYNTGDSMDEDERREIEDNEIEEQGEDIGSEDSEDEEIEEDEYVSDDGFLVDDDKVQLDQYSESEEEEIIERRSTNKRRSSRIIIQSDSEESDSENHQNADSNGSNDVMSVSMETMESVVVITGNAPNAEQIVEGKKFATTYLTTEDDEMSASTSTSKTETSQPKTITVETESVENESVRYEEKPKKEKKSTDKPATETTNAHKDELNPKAGEKNTPHSATVQFNGKENEIFNEKTVNKKQRTSLPGIDRLAKARKQANRTSLGDLYPNRLNVGFVESEQKKAKINVNKAITETKNDENNSVKDDNQSTVEPTIGDDNENNTNNDMNASSSSSGNVSPNKTTPLDVSSQEENNNQKISGKKSKKTRISEIIPVFSETAPETATATAEALGPVQNTPTTGLIENKNKKNKKSKRKFEEIDMDEEPYERPKAKKLLKIINTASGHFIEEPMTPEHPNKHGFQVTPLTPVNPSFEVRKRATNKRKSFYMDEDEAEAAGLLLPKPKWQIDTQFEREQPRKRARKLELGSSEVILQPLEPKNKHVKFSIPAELRQFRQQRMYRAGIPRQDARALLREKYKKKANYK